MYLLCQKLEFNCVSFDVDNVGISSVNILHKTLAVNGLECSETKEYAKILCEIYPLKTWTFSPIFSEILKFLR